MTTELTYLALTLILALVQVFLPAGARTVEFGSKWNAGPRDETASSALTVWGSALYFWARVVYVPLYALGIPYIRSLVWLVSLAGLVMVLTFLFL
ncbi:MAG: hypothetical protein B7Y85_11860 [Brevundimonas sp. 32-68-21]|nr:MAG: hypothetical protein B7Y85_11860 [Brevundimonas sp. 32-68-21]